jgi:adenosylcobinamide-GDP ribazoletransferase
MASFFPLVGAGIGGAAGTTAWIAAHALPPLAAAGIALAAGALLTGAIHLDALADSADALAGSTPGERLAIARDHHLGAYGALALVVDQLLKAAALASLASDARVIWASVCAGALSRTTAVAAMRLARPGRPDGLGAQVAGDATTTRAVFALVSAMAIVLIGAGPGDGAALALAAAVPSATWCVFSVRRFSGFTGDTIGAGVEVAEAATLLVAAAIV